MSWEDIKEKFAGFDWRSKMNENSALISIAALVVTVLALGISSYLVFRGPARGRAPTTMLFYDTVTHQTVTEPASAIPPLNGSDGKPTLVRAYYYTCDGNCKDRKLFFLERYSPKAKALLEGLSKGNQDTPAAMQAQMEARNGLELRLPDGTDNDWVPADSEQGGQIYATIRCPDLAKAPQPCMSE